MTTASHSRSKVPLPRPLDLTSGNLKASWEKFKQVWDSYEIITGLDKDTDKVRIGHFITAIGSSALTFITVFHLRTKMRRKTSM